MTPYKIIRSLSPFEMYDIMTRGVCPEFAIEGKKICTDTYGEYYLTNWMDGTKLDILNLYLSDCAFQVYTSKDRAKELELEFKSWDIFFNVWSSWYGGNTWTVGFSFTYDDFEKLYTEYNRIKKIDLITG